MKQILRFGFILFLTLVLAGCSSGAQTYPTMLNSTPPAVELTPIPLVRDGPVTGEQMLIPIGADQARAVLADVYQVSLNEIDVVSVERTVFSDDCLDTNIEGEVCTKEEVPGYIVTLEVHGSSHILHTTQSGSIVRIVSVKPAAE
jgi:hypothetical protein